MNYKIINKDTYYRKGVFRYFSEDCKCSTSMTARVDVTELVNYSRQYKVLHQFSIYTLQGAQFT